MMKKAIKVGLKKLINIFEKKKLIISFANGTFFVKNLNHFQPQINYK
jgi:hypothetical protein